MKIAEAPFELFRDPAPGKIPRRARIGGYLHSR
jgi:hypothetical protein